MTTLAQLAQLLAVQKRRVEQAMAQVKARNEQLRQRQSERNGAFNSWTSAADASQREQQGQVQVVSSHLGRGMDPNNLLAVARRREFLRVQADECWKVLTAAEAELDQARKAAKEAHDEYRKACNRQEALTTFAAKMKSAENQKQMRSEEGAVDDMLTNRYANGRGM